MAHPRVCGENKFFKGFVSRPVGSSPRVRGKHERLLHVARGGRLIPACAGKTRPHMGSALIPWAHPRVCGENTSSASVIWSQRGSSPRVRGKPDPLRPPRHRRGLIPACAGKTGIVGQLEVDDGAHPRVCGENGHRWTARSRRRGSSPRVRGKHRATFEALAGMGLIPACAGKTLRLFFWSAGGRAHPRVCGENARYSFCAVPRRGSSPRVRGKRRPLGQHRAARGLIPARAGKTVGVGPLRPHSVAHPRACGENSARREPSSRSTGSSPRVRGKRHLQRARLDNHGLIPARAGKTSKPSATSRHYWAHPRACGENGRPTALQLLTPGSSPRVRGKPRP